MATTKSSGSIVTIKDTPGYTPSVIEMGEQTGVNMETTGSIQKPETPSTPVPTSQQPLDQQQTVTDNEEDVTVEAGSDPSLPSPPSQANVWEGMESAVSGIVNFFEEEEPESKQDDFLTDPAKNFLKASINREEGGYESVLPQILLGEEGGKALKSKKAAPSIDVTNVEKAASEDILDQTTKASSEWNFGKLEGNSLVVHHTAGRGTVDGVIQTFKDRGYPAHFIIDREGKIHQVLGLDQRGQHTRNSEINDVTNANSWGVEIMANDDSDVLPAQVEASAKLAKFLNEEKGMPMDRIFGHGEINSHKQRTEGQTVINALRTS